MTKVKAQISNECQMTNAKKYVTTSGSKFNGSPLPSPSRDLDGIGRRDLICILEMIALNSTPGVSTQRQRKARSDAAA